MSDPRPLVVHARFVVVREQPLVVVDFEGDAPALPLVDDNLFKTLTERGLVVVPGFFGVALPKGARVGWTLGAEALTLDDDQDNALLRVTRGDVDEVWEAAALRLKGTMLCVGWNLGVGPDQTPGELCAAVDAAARQGRIAAAIVGVAQPRRGLPLLL